MYSDEARDNIADVTLAMYALSMVDSNDMYWLILALMAIRQCDG